MSKFSAMLSSPLSEWSIQFLQSGNSWTGVPSFLLSLSFSSCLLTGKVLRSIWIFSYIWLRNFCPKADMMFRSRLFKRSFSSENSFIEGLLAMRSSSSIFSWSLKELCLCKLRFLLLINFEHISDRSLSRLLNNSVCLSNTVFFTAKS